MIHAKPPVDLHWFFKISIRSKKKNSVRTEKKNQLVHTEIFFQLVYNWIFIPVWSKWQNGYFKKPVEINRGKGFFTIYESQHTLICEFHLKLMHHFTISTFWAVWCLRLLQLGNIAKIRLRLPRSVWQSSVLSRSSTYFPVFSILMWQTSIKWIIKSMQIMTKTYLNIRTLKIKQIETSEILSYSTS